MNYIFLSPHFPPNFVCFSEQLNLAGINVLGMGDTPWQDLPERVKWSLKEYCQIQNMENYGQVYRATAYLISRFGRIQRVGSQNEHWLRLESRLRADFNIPGMLPAELEQIQRKSGMKEVFLKAKIPVVPGRMVRTLEESRAAAVEFGFPMILKPDIGVGGFGAERISDDDDLQRYWSGSHPPESFTEPFIDGTLETFDGIADQNGKVVFWASLISPMGGLEVLQQNRDLYYYYVFNPAKDLEELGMAAIKAFNIRETFFHLEFLRSKTDGKLVAMELNKRPPGAFSMDMMNFSCDIDLFREYAHIVRENTLTGPWQRKYFCAHVARKYGKNYRLSHEDILSRHGEFLAMGQEVSAVFSAVMGNYAYLVRTTDKALMEQIARDIQEQW